MQDEYVSILLLSTDSLNTVDQQDGLVVQVPDLGVSKRSKVLTPAETVCASVKVVAQIVTYKLLEFHLSFESFLSRLFDKTLSGGPESIASVVPACY